MRAKEIIKSLNLKGLRESNYSKRPYFNRNSNFTSEGNEIIFWYATTPTGRESKYWATLTIKGDTDYDEHMINKIKNQIINYPFPKLPKGYTWSEPLVY